jgi:hypothetical protein
MKKSALNWNVALVGLLCSLFWLSSVQALSIGEPMEFSQGHKMSSQFMKVRLLGALKLSGEKVNGLAAHEISGIAWDEDEHLLYTVSDDGHVLHIRPGFTQGQLSGADLVTAYPLRDMAGSLVADTEGLTIRNGANGSQGDSELIVSLESVPRVMVFKPDGSYLKDYPVPAPLTSLSHNEDPDDGPQALAEHPKLGLIIGPGHPLKSQDPRFFTLYASDGKRWRYPSLDPEYSILVGLEAAPDGSLLLLERRYVNFNLLLHPVIFAVRRIQPGDASNPEEPLPVEEIAHFSTADDWSLDNFESIARHQGNRYFLVSDDNTSVIQKTLLVYLEILE